MVSELVAPNLAPENAIQKAVTSVTVAILTGKMCVCVCVFVCTLLIARTRNRENGYEAPVKRWRTKPRRIVPEKMKVKAAWRMASRRTRLRGFHRDDGDDSFIYLYIYI